jgi:hypothetical protein
VPLDPYILKSISEIPSVCSLSKKPGFTPIVNDILNDSLIFSFLERLNKLTMMWTEHLTSLERMRNTRNFIRKTLKEREHLEDFDVDGW